MCNVRYEYTTNNNTDNSLLELAFEREYKDYLGFSYKCKICEAVLVSILDAWLHLRNYHNIKTTNDYLANEELRKTINEMQTQDQVNEKQIEQRVEQDEKRDKIIIRKVVKPKQTLLLQFIRGETK